MIIMTMITACAICATRTNSCCFEETRTSVGRLWLAPFSSRNLTTSKWFSCAAM